MRRDLVKTIASAKDVTNAIVLTHNIDFVFLQTVVLSAFRRCGHPKLTIFADAQCAAESYRHQAPILEGLGIRYRVVPVAMAPGYRFHPKAVLLSSEKAATLWVGSGNLTFGGWRENGEIWVEHDSTKDLGAFAAFRDYLDRVLVRVPLRNSVAVEIAEAFDPRSKSWAEDLEEESAEGLIGRVGEGPALLEQLLPSKRVASQEHITICAPYFDPEGAALRALEERAKRVSVICQPRTTTLTREAFRTCGKRVGLKAVDFHRESAKEGTVSAFLHAKFIAVTQGNRTAVFAGSANCSKAALLASGTAGNAELMARQDMSLADFRKGYLSELEEDTRDPKLPPREEVEIPRDSLPALQALAARFEAGTLTVAYIPARSNVTAFEVDAAAVKFSVIQPGSVLASYSGEPRQVVVEATIDDRVHRSAPIWIDHEFHLSASARARSVADAIRNKLQPGKWTAAAWADVMEVFCKHLTYMPATAYGHGTPRKKEDVDQAEIFPFDDVFASGYEAPSLTRQGPAFGGPDANRRSLQQLLLNWFGIRTDEDESDQPPPPDEDEDDEVVDRPEDIKKLVQAKKKQKPEAEIDLRRLEKITAQIDAAMSKKEFLENRAPAALAGDIKFASVLLRVGLREGWLPEDKFFCLTFRVWSSLFFSGSPDIGKGWIEYRLSQAEDPKSFAAPLRSPEVAAALIGWALAVPQDAPAAQLARFELACALAVARLSWLWGGTDRSAVERELQALLVQTNRRNVVPKEALSAAAGTWSDMMRRGQALMHLERGIRNITPAQLRSQIRQPKLHAGEILWQGKFCVVLQDCPRIEGVEVKVLNLQGTSAESKFQAPFTIPLAYLLDEDAPKGLRLKENQRRVLVEFVQSLRKRFRRLAVEYEMDTEE